MANKAAPPVGISSAEIERHVEDLFDKADNLLINKKQYAKAVSQSIKLTYNVERSIFGDLEARPAQYRRS
jgi:hypothetical protein